MACWLAQPTANNDFCDEIDEIMKHEHEDVILLDDPLSSGTNLDLDIDSISDFLDTRPSGGATAAASAQASAAASAVSPMSPASTTDYSQPLNIYSIPQTTFPLTNNSQSNATTAAAAASAYATLGISPQFTTLSINPHQHPFSPNSQDSTNSSAHLQPFGQSSLLMNSKNNLRPPPYVQSQQHLQQQQQQQQQDSSVLGTSYPFQVQLNTDSLDVKRFRSASMNEGATQQHQTKIDPLLFDPYRFRSAAYGNAPYYGRTTSSTNTTATTTSSTSSLSTDVSSNSAWPFAGPPRPASSSFSEVINQQQQQLRLQNNLSASYGGSSFYSLQPRSQSEFLPEMNFQTPPVTNCTLYSLNQPTGGATSPSSLNSSALTRKRPSLVGFSVDEIKVDPSSPNCAIEQQSEPDPWSDIEQNSNDQIQDDNDGDDVSSDDDTTISTGFDADLTTSKPSQLHANASSLFWQYNVQAKGPKTKRILYLKERDPHLFREFSDPVYQIKLTQTKGHTLTKLRKGDGNDVTPNPLKLYQLGKQIRDLSSFVGKPTANTPSVYHGIYHADHTTNSNDTVEVKKEKNKIASRACRLRKKAQHEANKLKLHGLNEEHKTLIDLIASIKLIILKRYQDGQLSPQPSSSDHSLETMFDQLVTQKYSHPVAGNTDGFVQGILNDMERLYASKQQRSSSLNT